MSGITRSGYETLLYIGTAGSTAATQVTSATDVDYNQAPERGDTTIRGAGTSKPILTSIVTGLKPTVTFKHPNRPGAILTSLMAAASTGAAVAIRTKSYASGHGYDGDMTLEVKQSAPLNGVGMFEFTCEATDDEGRSPQLWV